MMTLARLLFGLGAYILLAFAFGKHLRGISLRYPPTPCAAREATAPAVRAAAPLPATLPQRAPCFLLQPIGS